MKAEYFGFNINEYNYKQIDFTIHRTREAAEKKHRVHFIQGEMPVSADLETIVIEGRDKFILWAFECDYWIDWKNKTLLHKEFYCECGYAYSAKEREKRLQKSTNPNRLTHNHARLKK